MLYPTGGPAEGNAGPLLDPGGWFLTGFIKTIAELIKGHILNGGWGEWTERHVEVTIRDRKTESRLLPYRSDEE